MLINTNDIKRVSKLMLFCDTQIRGLGTFFTFILDLAGEKKSFICSKTDFQYGLNKNRKTIKHYLDALQSLGLIVYDGRISNAYRISLRNLNKNQKFKDYLNGTKNLPNQFFKNICSLIKRINKVYDGLKIKSRDYGYVRLSCPTKGRMEHLKDVIVEFNPVDNPRINLAFKYSDLTGKQLPSTKCSFHLTIIRNNLTKSLLNIKNHLKDIECLRD